MFLTRMHSSTMRTARSVTSSRSIRRGYAWQGACMTGGVHGGGHAWQGCVHGGGGCMAGGVHGGGYGMHTPPVDRILDTCL